MKDGKKQDNFEKRIEDDVFGKCHEKRFTLLLRDKNGADLEDSDGKPLGRSDYEWYCMTVSEIPTGSS